MFAMIWNNVELFNVSEIEEFEDGSVRVYRFPREVRQAFDDGVRDYALGVSEMTTGCEIRFVGDGADITLSAAKDEGTVEIYRGDFFVRVERIPGDAEKTIELRSNLGVDRHDVSAYKGRFDTAVWRVVFDHDYPVKIHSVKPLSSIRPPEACEIPEKKIIAYGSSITHSATAVMYTNAYIYTLGRRLGCDVLCKGMGGSCFMQPRVAEYIATADADAILLELGINMVDIFSAEEFYKRAKYTVKCAIESGKPVILISNFTSHHDIVGAKFYENNDNIVKALESIYEEYKCDRLYYIRGRDIVDDIVLLAEDVLHPSPYGHITMGNRIADKLIRELGFGF